MKKCPYCAEEIQDDAIKCKHCGEWLNKQDDPPSSKDIPADKITTPIISSQEQSTAFHQHEERPQITGAGNKWFRWGVFVVGTIILAFIYAVWKTYDKSHGGGVFVGFLRGAICSGGIIWLFYWAKNTPSNNLKQSEPNVNNYRTAKIEKITRKAETQPINEVKIVNTQSTSEVKQQDEKFIELLKSSVNENGLSKILDNELIKTHNRARSIASCSNKIDIELGTAISKLSDEIKKRGLSQALKPPKIINHEKSFSVEGYKDVGFKEIVIIIVAIVFVAFPFVALNIYDSLSQNSRVEAETKATPTKELTAESWVNQARTLWIEGKYTDPNKAIEYLTNAIKLQPNYAVAYGVRGSIYDQIGQYQEAINDYNEAIRLKPDYAVAYHSRGLAYDDLGHYQRAIEDYNQAIRLKPDNAVAYHNRGLAYDNLGQHQRAIEDYNEAMRLQPNDAITYYNRGSAYADLGQFQRAIEDYNEAIHLEPNDADTYLHRGRAYSKLKQNQHAIEDYNQAIRLKPNDAMAYNNRGYEYNNIGQYQRALTDLHEAIRLKPDSAAPYKNRGNSYRYLGQYQQAIKNFNEAIRLKPDYAEAYNDRGNAYLKQGKIKLGCRDLQNACNWGDCNGKLLAKNQGFCN